MINELKSVAQNIFYAPNKRHETFTAEERRKFGRQEIHESKPGNDGYLGEKGEDDRRKECRVKGVAPTSKPVRISTPT